MYVKKIWASAKRHDRIACPKRSNFQTKRAARESGDKNVPAKRADLISWFFKFHKFFDDDPYIIFQLLTYITTLFYHKLCIRSLPPLEKYLVIVRLIKFSGNSIYQCVEFNEGLFLLLKYFIVLTLVVPNNGISSHMR